MIVVFEGPVQTIVKEAERYAETLPYGIAKAHNGTLQTKAAEQGEHGIDRIIILSGEDCYEFMRTNGVDPSKANKKAKKAKGADSSPPSDSVIEVDDPATAARKRFQESLEAYLANHPTSDVSSKDVVYHRYKPVVAPAHGGPAELHVRS
ncbi:MAG: hypothetical protein ACRDV9_10430 [Acidimicrobiia bacterium]